MLIILAILISLLVPLALLGLSYTRLRPGFLWLMALIGSAVAWLFVNLARNRLPTEIAIFRDQFEPWLEIAPALLVDDLSWLFAVAIITLPLVVLLTDIFYLAESRPQIWSSTLALGGLGLLAVTAANPVTLLLAWGVIDISEALIFLRQVQSSQERERVVLAFSVRAGGIFLLMVAMLQATSIGVPLTFSVIPPQVSGTILLAAAARLSAIPLHQLSLREPSHGRGLGTVIRLVPAGSSLVLLARVATVGVSGFGLSAFMVLSTIVAFFGTLAFIRTKDALQGYPYWILSLSAFTVASATKGLVQASTAWSLALILSGAMLFLFLARDRRMLVFPIFGMLGFSALPYTPAWEGVALFGALSWGSRAFFILALALLIVAFVQQSGSAKLGDQGSERWMWFVHYLGLMILLLTQFGVIYFQGIQSRAGAISFQTPGWWYSLIPLGLAALLLVLNHRGSLSAFHLPNRLSAFFDLTWLYRLFWWVYRQIGRLLTLFSRLLEGDGGVLWALLILILLVFSLSQLGLGGSNEF